MTAQMGTASDMNAPSLQRWRTAFWSAVVATPLVAGVLGVLLGRRMDGGNQIAVELSILIGAVAVVTVLACGGLEFPAWPSARRLRSSP
ncbi:MULTISPECIES: hypothetical protein [Dietzia]|uniref:hypothetical protein n=1 Tax=Dietzia TaxID=37914 RepID=UPI00101AE4C9|nr:MULTISPECIES: hypothetical protein [Dietzia]MCT1713478.1 hypothetical protein [Dietzia cinnamea]MCT2275523.1 hypothetical protein [Dietzia cinnamea]